MLFFFLPEGTSTEVCKTLPYQSGTLSRYPGSYRLENPAFSIHLANQSIYIHVKKIIKEV